MNTIIIQKFKHLIDSNSYSITHELRRNLEIYAYIKQQLILFPEFGNPANLIKCILKDIKYENLPKCKTCGKTTPFINIVKGHREYCSCKCRSNNTNVISKTKTTNIQKYGCENVYSSKEVKEKIKNTCLKKYGVECATQSLKHINNRKNTMISKYGVSNMICTDKVRNAIKKRQLINTYENMKRYTTVTPVFTEEQFVFNRLNDKKYEYDWKCKKCGNIFKQIFYKNCKFPRCYICDPLMNSVSKLETDIFNYIKSLNVVHCTQTDRTIINPQELDIVIPSKKLAIEFNGNYWHSEERGKTEFYHLEKTNKCLEVGYRLIHIFEDEWLYKQNIVKARLRNILGVTSRSIYARKCQIKEIDNSTKDAFLEKYHIQGKDKSSIKLGLFYKNRLVAVMTFSKRRFDNKEGFELVRYCTIANFNIIGGAGKLLAYFRKSHVGETIISYADKRWSQGNLYKKLGFTLIRESPPNYWYVNKEVDITRLSRYMFMKHKLKDKLEKFDQNLTEIQNMCNNGYTRIFDCGNYVFELK